MVRIRQLLVPSTIAASVTNKGKNTKRKVCIHETGNRKIAANADAHARLQAKGNSRQASWHWTVDNMEAVQSFPHDARCWAAGTAQGNNEAIHIEICVNSDGDYRQAVDNAAQLTAKILKEEKLTMKDIVQHYDYSGKNCPELMRSGKQITWQQFVTMVEGYLYSTEKKGVRTMEFSSPALKAETETTLASAARRKLIVEAAIEAGANQEVWTAKLDNKTITNDDLLGLAVKAIIDKI